VANLARASMAFVHGARLSSIHQLDLPFRVEQEADGVEELGLIGFDTHQVIATGIEHLLAEIALTEERIPGEHAAVPIDAPDQCGSDGQFGFLLLLTMLDRFTGQHHATLLTEGHQHMDGRSVVLILEPATLRPAIKGDPLAAPFERSRSDRRRKCGGHRRGEGRGIKLAEESMQGRLARCLPILEAQGLQEIRGLSRSPFRHGQDRGVGTEEGGDRQPQDCGQGIGHTRTPPRVRDGGECSDQAGRGDDDRVNCWDGGGGQ